GSIWCLVIQNDSVTKEYSIAHDQTPDASVAGVVISKGSDDYIFNPLSIDWLSLKLSLRFPESSSLYILVPNKKPNEIRFVSKQSKEKFKTKEPMFKTLPRGFLYTAKGSQNAANSRLYLFDGSS